ncbi:MAG: nitrophenyl compound nitroreductase subunit ArsF family protein [Alphaproteobacteria bacterium]|nr:nitrophenyl compound nitroreductase subunit ArsF family protein [Alphaproteobacteria bacterium]
MKKILIVLMLFSLSFIGVPKAEATGPKVIAYYFHGNFRCPTCRKFEAYTTEALQSGFAKELADGTLRLAVINIDKSENEHFVKDFQLTTRSVVVASADGKHWKRLDEIWQRVGNHDDFVKYIQAETAALLDKAQ